MVHFRGEEYTDELMSTIDCRLMHSNHMFVEEAQRRRLEGVVVWPAVCFMAQLHLVASHIMTVET